jgi:hypothetical protein
MNPQPLQRYPVMRIILSPDTNRTISEALAGTGAQWTTPFN